MTNRFIVGMTALCVLLLGCGSDVETGIIGAWRGITPKQDLVFYENGTIEMKGHHHGVYTGQYTIIDGNRLTCRFPLFSQPVECTARIRGDKLTLTHPAGRKEVYVRQ